MTAYIKVSKDLIKDGMVEIAVRNKKQQFAEFVKLGVEKHKNELSDDVINIVVPLLRNAFKKELDGVDELKSDATDLLRNANDFVMDARDITKAIAKIAVQFSNCDAIQMIQLAGIGANLIATTAGFVIVNKKLDEMSSKLEDIKDQIKIILKKDLADIEKLINEARSSYINMLDAKKRNKPFSEKEYYTLTVQLFTVLGYLYKLFMDNAVFKREAIINYIYLLLPMFANALKEYDTAYYFANKDQIKGDSIWHNQHDEWMALIKKFSSKKYLEKLRMVTFLDLDYNSKQSEATVATALLSGANFNQIVSDQQAIIQHFDNFEQYEAFEKSTIKEVVDECKESLSELSDEQLAVLNPLLDDAQNQLEMAIAR